jgi:hypothetical protein
MACAVRPNSANEPHDTTTGWINRRTGKIVLIQESVGDAEFMEGPRGPLDMLAARAAVEACPSDWIEIPKYHGDDENQDEFVREFLLANGLERLFGDAP